MELSEFDRKQMEENAAAFRAWAVTLRIIGAGTLVLFGITISFLISIANRVTSTENWQARQPDAQEQQQFMREHYELMRKADLIYERQTNVISRVSALEMEQRRREGEKP